MRLYYTTSVETDAVQQKIYLSLGGFKSGTLVPMNTINNFFSDITSYTVDNANQNQYIALILVNETGAEATNVSLWFDYPDDVYSVLRVASIDLNSEGMIERVQNIYTRPFGIAEFFEANGESNAVNIGDIPQDGSVAIWIERELLIDFITTNQCDVYEDDPQDPFRVIPKELGKLDNIAFNIKWDD